MPTTAEVLPAVAAALAVVAAEVVVAVEALADAAAVVLPTVAVAPFPSTREPRSLSKLDARW